MVCRGNHHDDVIKWKHFPRYWPFVRGIHRPQVNSPHKGQWRGTLMFPLICTRIDGWVNNREAGDLRRHRGHYDFTVMMLPLHIMNALPSTKIIHPWSFPVLSVDVNDAKNQPKVITLFILGGGWGGGGGGGGWGGGGGGGGGVGGGGNYWCPKFDGGLVELLFTSPLFYMDVIAYTCPNRSC